MALAAGLARGRLDEGGLGRSTVPVLEDAVSSVPSGASSEAPGERSKSPEYTVLTSEHGLPLDPLPPRASVASLSVGTPSSPAPEVAAL